jgi:transposase InsO family protein
MCTFGAASGLVAHLARDLRLFTLCCSKCGSYHVGKAPKQAYLEPPLQDAPRERWSIDLVGKLPKDRHGFEWLFTAIDCFSRFAVVITIRNKEAETVANCIVNHIFLQHGVADLQSDLGTEFQNQVLEAIVRLTGVDKFRTTAFRPSCNGKVERLHRTFNSVLAKAVSETQRGWSEKVNYLTFCYNACSHKSTGFCPFFLMTGQLPRWNVDLCLDNPSDDISYDSLPRYARDVIDRLERAYRLVRDALELAADKNSRWYDKGVREREFAVGDRVRIHIPRHVQGRSPKLQLFYKDIGTIVKRLNSATYLVTCKNWRSDRVVHADKLKIVRQFETNNQSSEVEHVTPADSVADDQLNTVAGVSSRERNDDQVIDNACGIVQRIVGRIFSIRSIGHDLLDLHCANTIIVSVDQQRERHSQNCSSTQSRSLADMGDYYCCPDFDCQFLGKDRQQVMDHLQNDHRRHPAEVRRLAISRLCDREARHSFAKAQQQCRQLTEHRFREDRAELFQKDDQLFDLQQQPNWQHPYTTRRSGMPFDSNGCARDFRPRGSFSVPSWRLGSGDRPDRQSSPHMNLLHHAGAFPVGNAVQSRNSDSSKTGIKTVISSVHCYDGVLYEQPSKRRRSRSPGIQPSSYQLSPTPERLSTVVAETVCKSSVICQTDDSCLDPSVGLQPAFWPMFAEPTQAFDAAVASGVVCDVDRIARMAISFLQIKPDLPNHVVARAVASTADEPGKFATWMVAAGAAAAYSRLEEVRQNQDAASERSASLYSTTASISGCGSYMIVPLVAARSSTGTPTDMTHVDVPVDKEQSEDMDSVDAPATSQSIVSGEPMTTNRGLELSFVSDWVPEPLPIESELLGIQLPLHTDIEATLNRSTTSTPTSHNVPVASTPAARSVLASMSNSNPTVSIRPLAAEEVVAAATASQDTTSEVAGSISTAAASVAVLSKSRRLSSLTPEERIAHKRQHDKEYRRRRRAELRVTGIARQKARPTAPKRKEVGVSPAAISSVGYHFSDTDTTPD